MKSVPLRAILMSVALVACSTSPALVTSSEVCDARKSYSKGKKDAELALLPSTSAFRDCDPGKKAIALKAYKRGYESFTDNSIQDEVETEETSAWVCEIEANSKVFTGVGLSQEEASQSARKTCDSHIQSSSCGSTECRKSL